VLSWIVALATLLLGTAPSCSTRLLVGIGAGGASSSGSTTGSGGGGSSSVSTVSVGPGGAGGTGTGGGGGTVPVGYGTVTVVSEVFVGPDGGPLPIQDLIAGFFAVPESCTGSTYGSCVVSSCPAPSKVSPMSAGVVTVTGTTPTLTVDPDGGVYPLESDNEPTVIWHGGETITATATGGAVPPFTLSGVAPSNLDLEVPALPSSGPIPVDRTADLAFTWASNGGGTVVIDFLSVSGVSVVCQLPQAPGGGVVPSAALQQLPQNEQGTLTVMATGSWTKNVGGWALTLQLVGPMTWGGTQAQSSTFTTID
jgi:hypothetical protein